MSIAQRISTIQTDRNTIRAKLVELGLATNTDKLTALAAAIEDIVNQGAVSVEIKEGTIYTIPAGFHNGSGVVKAISDAAGDAETYKTQAKVVTPTKKQQSVTPDVGYYALESVTVYPIPDAYQDVTSVTATAEDTLTGKIFVAADGTVVTGTMPNNGTVDKILDCTTLTYTIPKGMHSGTGKIQIIVETKTVTPTKAVQEITPTDGKVLSKVTVAAIPDAYQDVTPVDATAADVVVGKTIVAADGTVIEGGIPVNGDVSRTIDGLTTTSVEIPAGSTTGGTVSLTDDIEEALAAI